MLAGLIRSCLAAGQPCFCAHFCVPSCTAARLPRCMRPATHLLLFLLLAPISAMPTGTTDVLFKAIERWHGEDSGLGAGAEAADSSTPVATPWAASTVLDAGTGRSSLGWLTQNVQPQFVTAVTADTERADTLRAEFLIGAAASGEVLVGSWVAPTAELPWPALAPGAAYDVVLADYLLGAVDVFTPYFQPSLFPALAALLRRGSGARFYVVGLQPLPGRSDVDPRDEGAQLLSEIVRTRDACITLAGHRPHREYPLDWVRQQLEDAGVRFSPHSFAKLRTSGSFLAQFRDDLCHSWSSRRAPLTPIYVSTQTSSHF